RAYVSSREIDPSGIDPEIVDTLNPLAIRAWSLQTVEEHDEKHGMPCRAIVSIPKHRRPSPIRHPYEGWLAKRKAKIGIGEFPQHDIPRLTFLEARGISNIKREIPLPPAP